MNDDERSAGAALRTAFTASEEARLRAEAQNAELRSELAQTHERLQLLVERRLQRQGRPPAEPAADAQAHAAAAEEVSDVVDPEGVEDDTHERALLAHRRRLPTRVCNRVLFAWREAVADKRRLRLLVERHVHRAQARRMNSCFHGWAALTQASGVKRDEALQRARQARARTVLHAAFTEWRDMFALRAWHTRMVDSATRRRQRSSVQTCFAAWRALAGAEVESAETICRALRLSRARRLLASCFDRWRAQNDSSLERLQGMAHALTLANANTQRRVLAAWLQRVRSRRRRRVLQARAEARVSRLRLRAAFVAWVALTEEARALQHAAAELSSAAQEQGASHRESSVSLAASAVELTTRLHVRAHAFASWRACIADAAGRATAAEQMAGRLQRRRSHLAFESWTEAVQHAQARRAALLRVLSTRVATVTLRGTWRAWRAIASDLASRREAASAMARASSTRAAFSAWRGYTGGCLARRTAFQTKRVARMKHGVFHAWRYRAAVGRIQAERVPLLRAHHTRLFARRVLLAWHLAAAVSRRKAAGAMRLVAQRQRKHMTTVLAAWAEAATVARVRGNLLDRSVVLLQSTRRRRELHEAMHAWKLVAAAAEARAEAASRMARALQLKRVKAAFHEWREQRAHTRRTQRVLTAAVLRRNVRVAKGVLAVWHLQASATATARAEKESFAAITLAAGLAAQQEPQSTAPVEDAAGAPLLRLRAVALHSRRRTADAQLLRTAFSHWARACAMSRLSCAASQALQTVRRAQRLRMALLTWRSETVHSQATAAWMRAATVRRANRAMWAVLHAWCAWTRRRRASRATVAGAVTARQQRTLASCLHAWQSAVRYARSMRELEAHVSAHADTCRVQRSFAAWADAAVSTRGQHAQASMDALLRHLARARAARSMATALHVWREHTARRRTVATLLARRTAHVQLQCMRSCFRAWQARAVAGSVAAVFSARLTERRRVRTLRAVFARWSSAVDLARARHAVLSLIGHQVAWQGARHVLSAWREVAAAKRQSRQLLARCAASLHHLTMRTAFKAWQEAARDARVRRLAAEDVASLVAPRVLMRAFGGWASVTALKLSRDASVLHAHGVLRRGLLRRVLVAWKATVQADGQALQAVAASRAQRTLLRCFGEWRGMRAGQELAAGQAAAAARRRTMARCLAAWHGMRLTTAAAEAAAAQAATRVQMRHVRAAFAGWRSHSQHLVLARRQAARLAALHTAHTAHTARAALRAWRVTMLHAARAGMGAAALRQRVQERVARGVLWAWRDEAANAAALRSASAADASATQDALRVLQQSLQEAQAVAQARLARQWELSDSLVFRAHQRRLAWQALAAWKLHLWEMRGQRRRAVVLHSRLVRQATLAALVHWRSAAAQLRAQRVASLQAALDDHSRAAVSRCFAAWRRATHARLAAHIVALACAAVVRRHTMARHILRQWHALAAAHTQEDGVVLRHRRHREGVLLRHTLAEWAAHVAHLRRARSVAHALARSSDKRHMAHALVAWRAATARAGAARVSADRMAVRAAARSARHALTAWRVWAHRKRTLSTLLAGAQLERGCRSLKACLVAWKDVAARRAARDALLRQALSRLLTRRLRASFAPWRALVAHAKWRRHQLRTALQHRTHDALRAVLLTWRRHAVAARLHGQRAPLRWAVRAWCARVQHIKELQARAVAHADGTALRTAWLAWSTAVAAKRARDVQLRRMEAQRSQDLVRNALRQWRAAVCTAQRARALAAWRQETLAAAEARGRRLGGTASLSQWQSTARIALQGWAAVAAAARAERHSDLSTAFRTWRVVSMLGVAAGPYGERPSLGAPMPLPLRVRGV
jgi:hypothetical protein